MLLHIDSFEGFGLTRGKYSVYTAVDVNAAYGRNGRGVRVDANFSHALRKDFPAQTTIVVGAAYEWTGNQDSSFDNIAFYEDNTTHIALRFNGNNGSIRLYRGATIIATTAAGVFIPGVFHYVEIKAFIHDTLGTAEVRIDGTTVISFGPGDTRNGGAVGTVDNIGWGAHSGATGNLYIDDLYILDTIGAVNVDFLGDCVVEYRQPNGNGNYSQFLGSDADSINNYLLVDDNDPPDGDTTYVVDGVAAEKDTYQVQDLAATAASVLGVQLELYARHEGAGGTLRGMLRRGVTDAFGAVRTPAATYAWMNQLWDLDPVAAAAWTIANFNATEFGQEIVS